MTELAVAPGGAEGTAGLQLQLDRHAPVRQLRAPDALTTRLALHDQGHSRGFAAGVELQGEGL